MAKKRCRLCKSPAVEDSLFCANHRAQAAMFSSSFAAAPTASRPKKSAAKTAIAVEEDEIPASPWAADRDSPLREAVAASVDTLAEHMQAEKQTQSHRWPQLSLYYLEGTLHGRLYYSVIPVAALATSDEAKAPSSPTSDGTSNGEGYEINAELLENIFSASSPLLDRLESCFHDVQDQLKTRDLLTLDLHFLSYANLIAINTQSADHTQENLVTFSVENSSLQTVPLEDTRAALRHDRW